MISFCVRSLRADTWSCSREQVWTVVQEVSALAAWILLLHRRGNLGFAEADLMDGTDNMSLFRSFNIDGNMLFR